MRSLVFSISVILISIFSTAAFSQMADTSSGMAGLIPAFPIRQNEMSIHQLAQPFTPFDKVGRKFAILGYESGSFEAWAYPLKLLRNFELSFFLENSARPIRAADIVRYVEIGRAHV